MTARPLLVIPEAAKEALAKKIVKPDMTKEPWVAHPSIRRAVALYVRRQVFGPSMQAPFRQQCLQWSSFRALDFGRL